MFAAVRFSCSPRQTELRHLVEENLHTGARRILALPAQERCELQSLFRVLILVPYSLPITCRSHQRHPLSATPISRGGCPPPPDIEESDAKGCRESSGHPKARNSRENWSIGGLGSWSVGVLERWRNGTGIQPARLPQVHSSIPSAMLEREESKQGIGELAVLRERGYGLEGLGFLSGSGLLSFTSFFFHSAAWSGRPVASYRRTKHSRLSLSRNLYSEGTFPARWLIPS